jgi:hypothetical protein
MGRTVLPKPFFENTHLYWLSRIVAHARVVPARERDTREARKKGDSMRVDRPLLGAILFLGSGMAVIIGYCHGTTGFSAVYPFSGSMLHIDMTTTGPGVLGGLGLMSVGALFLVWAFLAAIVSLFTWNQPRRERVTARYSVVPSDDDGVPEDAEISEERQHFWSRPSRSSHI